MILQIRHLPGTDPVRFQVLNPDPKNIQMGAETDKVPNPVSYPVAGWPNMALLPGLTWYLERFLDYPFYPETTHAALVQKALRQWGQESFEALFGDRRAGRWFDQATATTYADLYLQIVSNDPAVLAWPWEALYDGQAGCRLAHTCQVERRLDQLREPPTLGELPKGRVNILLLIARPYEHDVRFRSVARALVEWADRPEVPAHVHVLRPPTLDRLRAHLREKPGFYHLLHFDGHGAYGDGAAAVPGGYTFQTPVQGRLIFETEDGSPDPVAAETLSDLLREHAVPAVVLYACQSAMLDRRADDPFASVAAALLRAGMRSVTAMSYSLYVSGAQQFLPAFYQRLFERGELTDAVRAGRQQMLSRPERVCVLGTFPLEDWLVPVLYQQDPVNFTFVKEAKPKERGAMLLPAQARDERNAYGFLGRDSAVLALERALRRRPAGILISGLGGVGKTTLVRGFLHWLEQTGGLGEGVFWFGFADTHSAEHVLNRLGEALLGADFGARRLTDPLKDLTEECRRRRFLIVWDNFESARGIAGTAVTGNLTPEDCELLRQFLSCLGGGATKVLITSRSTEDWLGASDRYLLPLGGLDGEERWEFANAILRGLGKKVDRSDKGFDELIKLLNGHPLAMRVLLPRLEHSPAAAVVKALRENTEVLKSAAADENEARLFATLRFATDALPAAWQPLLVPIAQHEGFVHADLLEQMAQQVDTSWTRAAIDGCLGALTNAGLLRPVEPRMYELHPAVMGSLRASSCERGDNTKHDVWLRAFVNVMAGTADYYASRQLHEQRGVFTFFEETFHSARELAARLDMSLPYAALTQSLAFYAKKSRNYPVADRLFRELAAHRHQSGDDEGEGVALSALGSIAKERGDLDAAEGACRKCLAIAERLGLEPRVASTYRGLGTIALERRDLDGAEGWYRKALAIEERRGDEPGAADTYHQLGRIAEERRDLDAAENWARKALAIKERQHDEAGTAYAYHQLGRIAEDRRDLDAAEDWYRKALVIEERLGYEPAATYHQLGNVTERRGELDAAEGWYHKTLAIEERRGDERGAATTYHQLGWIALERRDLEAAEGWYHKALAIEERRGDERGAATCKQLGDVARNRQDLDGAEGWYRKALAIQERRGDERNAALTYLSLGTLAVQRGDFDAVELWYQKFLVIGQRLVDLPIPGFVKLTLDHLAELRKTSS